jgi:hypothetical protein
VIEHQPKFVYLIPTFSNPSGALLSLSAATSAGHGGQAQHTGRRRRPYGDLYTVMPRHCRCWRWYNVPGSRELIAYCGSSAGVERARPACGLDGALANTALLCLRDANSSATRTSTFARATRRVHKTGGMPQLIMCARVHGDALAMGRASAQALGDAIRFTNLEHFILSRARPDGPAARSAMRRRLRQRR